MASYAVGRFPFTDASPDLTCAPLGTLLLGIKCPNKVIRTDDDEVDEEDDDDDGRSLLGAAPGPKAVKRREGIGRAFDKLPGGVGSSAGRELRLDGVLAAMCGFAD